MRFETMSPLRYLFYIFIHPVTGFEELKYNKKGSLVLATCIMLLFFVANVMNKVVCAYIFNPVRLEDVNILWILTGCFGIVAVFTIANWLVCTLLDGKGSLREIWIAVCYALAPYTLFIIPLNLATHLLTQNEAVFFTAATMLLTAWSGLLLLAGMMGIHQFTMSKNFSTLLLTVVGMLIILFLVLLFFTLMHNVYTFVRLLYNEMMFRL